MPRWSSSSIREMSSPARRAQAVEIEDDQDVTLAQVIQTGGQVRPVGNSSGSAVLEHALTPGTVQSIELAVEYLTAFGGRYAGIANESHGVMSSLGIEKDVLSGLYRKKITSGLS